MYSKNGLYFKVPNVNSKKTAVIETHYALAWGNWVFVVNSKRLKKIRSLLLFLQLLRGLSMKYYLKHNLNIAMTDEKDSTYIFIWQSFIFTQPLDDVRKINNKKFAFKQAIL